MKTFTKIVAAALTACLAVCSAAPVNAADTDVNYDILIPIEDTPFAPSFTSDEEMLQYIRTQMKKRNENITVLRKGVSKDDLEKYKWIMQEQVFEPTGDPKEGAYLRLGMVQYELLPHVTDEGIELKIAIKYRTTAAQEERLDSNIETIVEMIPAVMGADYNNLPEPEKIAKGYNYFNKIMRSLSLSDNMEDATLSTAYSALVKGEANEIGFLQLFIRALGEIGINADVFPASSEHYLATISIDGTNYLADPVWDYLSGSTSGNYKFLLKGFFDIDSGIDSSSEYRHMKTEPSAAYKAAMIDLLETWGISLYSYDKKFEFGDVSGDGLIDSVDASAILAEYARLSSSDKHGIFSAGQKTAADIDKNSRIDSVDTSTILSYYAYKSTTSDNTTLSEFISKK